MGMLIDRSASRTWSSQISYASAIPTHCTAAGANDVSWHPDIAARSTNMTLDDFRRSLTATEPPAELTLALAGLWWDANPWSVIARTLSPLSDLADTQAVLRAGQVNAGIGIPLRRLRSHID